MGQPTWLKWYQRWPGECPGTAQLMISTVSPLAARRACSRRCSRIDSNRCSTSTPQPAPIESPTSAIRNVRAGFGECVVPGPACPASWCASCTPLRSVASSRFRTTSRRSSTRMTRGASSKGTDQVLPGRRRDAQARHVGQVVEPPARVEQLLVIAALDPLEVDPVQEIALEAVAQPRRTIPGEPVRHQPASQDHKCGDQLPAHHQPHDPWNPRLTMSSQAERLGLDHSDQSTAIVVNVAATLIERTASSRTRGPIAPRPVAPHGRRPSAGVKLDVHQHQHAQDSPEQGVGNREAPAPAQPVRLVGVQEPGGQEDRKWSPPPAPPAAATA